MSKISLEPNDSGAGTFSIVSPDSNTNRTLNLPDEAGVVLTDTSDIEPQVKTATNAGGSAPIYACRAWVNFDGKTSPGTIRASGNVSSVTRNGTGDYTVNFTTAMPDANYSLAGFVQDGTSIDNGRIVNAIGTDTFSTTSKRVRIVASAGPNNFNPLYCTIQFFR